MEPGPSFMRDGAQPAAGGRGSPGPVAGSPRWIAAVWKSLSGKFVDDDLDERGNAFAAACFHYENGRYLADYEEVLGAGMPSLYHVPDTWESFDRLKHAIDWRFLEWQKGARDG